MNLIELTGHVDEQHQLHAEVPSDIGPGPVKLIVITPGNEDVTDEEWRLFISQQWAAEWSDPREDIYTLDDGVPVNNTDGKA